MKLNFYVMRTCHTNYAYVKIKEDQLITRKCPMCGAVLTEQKYNKYKLQIIGKKEGDFLFSPFCNIVSNRLLKLLYDNLISGFLEKEINCIGWYDRRGKLLEKDHSTYKELIVIGRGGCLKNKDGVEVPKCPKCGLINLSKAHKEIGFCVDSDWDGSDIFYLKNWPKVIIVTEKVKILLEKNKIKNVSFADLEEFTFS